MNTNPFDGTALAVLPDLPGMQHASSSSSSCSPCDNGSSSQRSCSPCDNGSCCSSVPSQNKLFPPRECCCEDERNLAPARFFTYMYSRQPNLAHRNVKQSPDLVGVPPKQQEFPQYFSHQPRNTPFARTFARTFVFQPNRPSPLAHAMVQKGCSW